MFTHFKFWFAVARHDCDKHILQSQTAVSAYFTSKLMTNIIVFAILHNNPLNPHDASKHHFASLKNELIPYTKSF